MQKTIYQILGLLTMLLLAACSRPSTSTYYYNACWMNDGRILAVRESSTGYSGALTGSGADTHADWVIMTIDSTGKVTKEQEIEGLGNQGNYFTVSDCSPKGTYISRIWTEKIDGVERWGLSIYKKSNDTYTKYKFIPLDQYPGINGQWDWSPDESKIIIAAKKPIIISPEGTLIKELNSIDTFQAWRYNNSIAGHNSNDETCIYFVDENDNITSKSPSGNSLAFIQYFPEAQSYLAGYSKVSLPDFQTTETYSALEAAIAGVKLGYRLITYPINPANQNQIMFDGSSWHGSGPTTREGIYLINLDGTGIITVKGDKYGSNE
jgi:hypothetical protein